MRNRGDPKPKFWDPDPDAEARWAATDSLIQALQNTGVLDPGWDVGILRTALDTFWQSAYECAVYRAGRKAEEDIGDEVRKLEDRLDRMEP